VRAGYVICLLVVVALGGYLAAPRSRAAPNLPTTTIVTTVIYTMPASSMEPTIHCALPGVQCLAQTDDRLVTREPPGKLSREDIVVFLGLT
jgi:hypothetical protein